jgi:hypothetical protein
VTLLEQLASTTDTLVADLVDRRRVFHHSQATVPSCATEWGRRGNTHFKDNKWYKNSDPPKKGR